VRRSSDEHRSSRVSAKQLKRSQDRFRVRLVVRHIVGGYPYVKQVIQAYNEETSFYTLARLAGDNTEIRATGSLQPR